MKARFHLPNFSAYYKFNLCFAELLAQRPQFFREGVEIASIYGVFPPSLWNGGRTEGGVCDKRFIKGVIQAFNERGIPLRFTFTNPMIEKKHLSDDFCNMVMHYADNGMNEVIVFSPLLVNAYSAKLKNRVPSDPVFRPDEHIKKALYSLSADSSVMLKKGVLYSVCAAFDTGTDYVPPDYKNNHFYEIFSYIDGNYTKECSLSEAAKQIGMNYSYISRDFKRLVGINFNDYVNLLRLNLACHLLKNTDYSVTECSLESGFGSTHTFNRNFKDRYGVTPNQYRKSFKEQNKR